MIQQPTCDPLCRALWGLTLLFALRVVAQPLALFVPQLPPFDSWHGNAMPYPALLSFQLGTLAVMAVVNHARMHGRLIARPGLARVLTVLGTVYFTAMLARLALGQTQALASTWFDRPLPTLFHLVLATWLLLLARQLSNRGR